MSFMRNVRFIRLRHTSRIILPCLLLLLFLTPCRAQQYAITGKVTDAANRQALAFVNVVVNDGQYGGMTDIDGKYEVVSPAPITHIGFSYIGYEAKHLDVASGTEKLHVALQPIAFELGEVTVKAGENPAHRIIDSVVAYRRRNAPDGLQSYAFTLYDKMVITIDSSELGTQNMDSVIFSGQTEMAQILEKNDLMVMETVSEQSFMAPDHKRQHVVGNKVSGLKNPSLYYMVSNMQSTNFYEDNFSIAEHNYLNPISRGSKRHYFFRLEATMPIGQGDTLYVISFHPKERAGIDGLNGTMTVNSDGWAIQNVKASPAKSTGLFKATIQQLYEKVEGHWFPKQLNTNLIFSGLAVNVNGNAFPMSAIGKGYLYNIRINPKLDRSDFSEILVDAAPDAARRDEKFWTAHRIDSLSERTAATYAFVDSISKHVVDLDVMLNLAENLTFNNAIPIGMFDVKLGQLISYSFSRGIGFGLGAATNDRFSRLIRLNAYGSYWLNAKRPDFGGGIQFNLSRRRQATAGLQFSQGSDAIGGFDGFNETGSILAPSNYKYLYENIDVYQRKVQASLTSRIGEHLKGFINLSLCDKNYQKAYYISSDSLAQARYATAEIKLRFAYKEKFVQTTNSIRSLGTLYPIVWFSYLRSFKDVLSSQYAFNRYKIQLTKNFYFSRFGVTQILMQGGWVDASAPVVEAFDMLGTGESFGLYAPGSFSTMLYDEFFCDRFIALYLSHNFGGLLLPTGSSWFKPELILATNIAWGDMKRATSSPAKNFNTIEKGYFESGIVIDGLLNISTVKAGVGTFYRYGPYSFDNVRENFAWKLSLSLNM